MNALLHAPELPGADVRRWARPLPFTPGQLLCDLAIWRWCADRDLWPFDVAPRCRSYVTHCDRLGSIPVRREVMTLPDGDVLASLIVLGPCVVADRLMCSAEVTLGAMSEVSS